MYKMEKLALNIFLLSMTAILSEQECTNTKIVTTSGIGLGSLIAFVASGIEINLFCGLFYMVS